MAQPMPYAAAGLPDTLQEDIEKLTNTDPTSWNASDVKRWAKKVGLSESTVKALGESETMGQRWRLSRRMS
jgi:hypothetical protein